MTLIWGNLAKTNSDNTLIDEAISAAVTSHNNDPDSHLSEGQALQSHRAAEIIDHLAESVVNDKIKANARTYLAIVDPAGDGDFTTVEDACDYAFQFGSGSIFIKKGNYTPARDLKLKYGIDLYGEGPEETNIDLSNGTHHNLNVSGDGIIECDTVDHIYYYADWDQFEFTDGDHTKEDLDGVYMITSWGEGLIGIAPVNPFFNTFWDNAPSDGDETDVEIEPTVTASFSSDIVHVNGWAFCTGLENGEGLQVATADGVCGDFLEYLGNGDIKLTTNSEVECDKSRGLYYLGPAGRMSIIQGVSFNCVGSSYVFKVGGDKGRLYVRDASFSNCSGLFKTDAYYNTQDARNCVIEDTVLNFPSGSCNLSMSGGTLRNCQLYFGSTAYPYRLGGAYSYFENCTFQGSLGGTTNKLQSVQRDSRFNGCVFNSFANGDVVNNGSYAPANPAAYVSFVGCTFLNGGAWPIVFSGNNIIVTGCRFYTAGANVGLKSTTRYSTFTGNQGRGVLLAQPTDCIVTANGFWPSMS